MTGIKIVTGLAAIGLAMSISFQTVAGEKYKIKENTKVSWLGKKVTGEHYGDINLNSGTLMMDNGQLKGGSFSMDMNSIVCTDMEGEYADKLVGHLKSDDFFGVAKYSTAQLKIIDVSQSSDGKTIVKADLTIKGITNTVEFPVKIATNNDVVGATGEITVDRTKYDIKYGSGSFFDDLGDKMIEDNFTLTFEFTASK